MTSFAKQMIHLQHKHKILTEHLQNLQQQDDDVIEQMKLLCEEEVKNIIQKQQKIYVVYADDEMTNVFMKCEDAEKFGNDTEMKLEKAEQKHFDLLRDLLFGTA